MQSAVMLSIICIICFICIICITCIICTRPHVSLHSCSHLKQSVIPFAQHLRHRALRPTSHLEQRVPMRRTSSTGHPAPLLTLSSASPSCGTSSTRHPTRSMRPPSPVGPGVPRYPASTRQNFASSSLEQSLSALVVQPSRRPEVKCDAHDHTVHQTVLQYCCDSLSLKGSLSALVVHFSRSLQ